MAWYHDEWNRQNELEQNEQHKQRVIQQSNFWADLQRQIEQDVAGINDSPWKDRLAGHPLTVQRGLHGEAYSVRKVGYPAITITLRHLGDHVNVVRDMAQDLREQYDSEEELHIGSDGRQVYLQTEGNKRLSVPEEAAQYILRPIIDALKTVRPT